VRQLKVAGCEKVFREKITGTTANRPQLDGVFDGVHLASMPPTVALAPVHNRPTGTGALAKIDRF